MKAGKLRHRITIKKTIETDDTHHGFSEGTLMVANRIPAKVVPLSGRELERAQQIDPRTTHRVEIRHRTGLRAGQTVVFHDPDDGDRVMELVGKPIDVDEARIEMHLLCKEQEAA